MDEKPKFEFNWKRSLITIGIVFVTAGVVGGTVWYIMDQNQKSIEESNAQQTAAMQKQINDVKNTVSEEVETKTTTTQPALTDSDYLNYMTINKSGFVSANSYVAPIISAKEGNWATTSPLPVKYDSTTGYTIPGMGGSIYVWEKVNGVWAYVGRGGEGGYDDAVKAKYSVIPLTVIPQDQR